MSYRRNERHGAEWNTASSRDPYEERSGRHQAPRPSSVNRRQLMEQLYDVYDDELGDEEIDHDQ